MNEKEKYIRTELREIILYLFIGSVLFVLLPMAGGFIGKAFSEFFASQPITISTYLGQFVVYFFLMIGALLLPLYSISRIIFLNRYQHPATQKDPKWWTIFTVSLIHSPEENGALYRLFDYFKFKKNPMNWSLSMLRITVLSVLLFGLFGIFQLFNPQLALASVPNTLQQVSITSDIIFGAGVPAFTENGVILFIFFFLLGINAYICSKFKLGLGGFFAIGFIFTFILAGIWMLIHSMVYGASDIKLFNTFIFGWMGAILTLLFASILPFLILHISNNFFIKLSKLAVAKEDIVFIVALLWVFLLVIYITSEFLIHKYRKKKQERIIVPT